MTRIPIIIRLSIVDWSILQRKLRYKKKIVGQCVNAERSDYNSIKMLSLYGDERIIFCLIDDEICLLRLQNAHSDPVDHACLNVYRL